MTRELWTALALTAALVLVEAALPHGGHTPLGTFAAVGIVGALVLGLGAKALGAWLQRSVTAEGDGARWEAEP